MQFLEASTVQGENFAEHIFVMCPQYKKQKKILNDQIGIWQAFKTSMLNIVYECTSKPWNSMHSTCVFIMLIWHWN